jgi:hypothetical protein
MTDYLGPDPCEGCFPEDPERQVVCRNDGQCTDRAAYQARRDLLERLKGNGHYMQAGISGTRIAGWYVWIPEGGE